MDRLTPIRAWVDTQKAAEVAECFVSPFIDPTLICEATREEGPSMWIVNRSDVYDSTLEALSHHSIEGIAKRSAEKLSQRRSNLITLTPPDDVGPPEEIPDFAVEDQLGHPLCPFEIIEFFSRSANADYRASSALSLTRRTVEYPPNWALNLELKTALAERFSQLLIEDASEFVRSYSARVPLLPESALVEAARKEKSCFVLGRILQNPATSLNVLSTVIERAQKMPLGILDDEFVGVVLALDARLGPVQRQWLIEHALTPNVSRQIHHWYLDRL